MVCRLDLTHRPAVSGTMELEGFAYAHSRARAEQQGDAPMPMLLHPAHPPPLAKAVAWGQLLATGQLPPVPVLYLGGGLGIGFSVDTAPTAWPWHSSPWAISCTQTPPGEKQVAAWAQLPPAWPWHRCSEPHSPPPLLTHCQSPPSPP